MEKYTILIISILLSLAVCGIYNIIYRKYKLEGKQKRIALIVCMLVIIALLGILRVPTVKQGIMSTVIDNYKIRKHINKHLLSLVRHPQIKEKFAKIKPKMEAKQFADSLSHKGLRLLNESSLLRWNQIRHQLVSNSSEFCEALWANKVNETVYVNALATLPEKMLSEYLNILKKSALLEVKEIAVPKATILDFNLGYSEVLKSHNEADKERMKLTYELGPKASSEDGCWFIRNLMAGAEKIDESKRYKFIRFLAEM